MSKADQIRALREQAYADRLKAPNYDGVREKLQAQSDALKAMKLANVKAAVSNVVTHVVNNKTGPLSNAEKQRRWREKHPDLHRERSRESMRKLRAEKKANASA